MVVVDKNKLSIIETNVYFEIIGEIKGNDLASVYVSARNIRKISGPVELLAHLMEVVAANVSK